MINRGRKRLGAILLDNNLISEEELNKALSYQSERGGRLGAAFVSLGILSEYDLMKNLSSQFNLEIIDMSDVDVDENVLELFSESFIKDNLCIPYVIEDEVIGVIVSDPTNILIKDEIKRTLGLESKYILSNSSSIESAIYDFYLQNKVSDSFKEVDSVETNEFDFEEGNTSIVIDIVNTMLRSAIGNKASDIHVGVVNQRVFIRFRVDGILMKYKEYPLQIYKNLVSRIKTISNLNVTDTRGFQGGRISRVIGDMTVDMRVSTLPTIYGEKVVIRILDKTNLFSTIDNLGFSVKSKEMFKKVISYPYGMILITGPTGSGKSSTLYTTISELFDITKNVITIEDPVEYMLNGIEQVQVNELAGITFTEGLRSILRQDPDIIMVGEIRDKDTAEIASRAALTGHLVFSTLHTNDAISSITRLTDMGVEPYLVASTVMGVVNQRLVRKLCSCKKEVVFDGNKLDRLYLEISDEDSFTVYEPVGCKECNDSGFKGRIALHELLVLDEDMRRIIAEGATESAMKDIAVESNFVSLKEDALYKIKEGLTSIAEVRRHVI